MLLQLGVVRLLSVVTAVVAAVVASAGAAPGKWEPRRVSGSDRATAAHVPSDQGRRRAPDDNTERF